MVRELVLDMAGGASLADRVLTGLVFEYGSALFLHLEKLLLALSIFGHDLTCVVLFIEVNVVLVFTARA